MKNCKGCAWAEWRRTANGRLHPSGDGKCTYIIRVVALPACANGRGTPVICRYINRNHEFKDHCMAYTRADAP